LDDINPRKQFRSKNEMVRGKATVEYKNKILLDLAEKESIKVLHVDDEDSLLKVAKQCLEVSGSFRIDTATSVEEAVQRMRENKFDVIVSDYRMPEKDGLEFLKRLRESGNNIPFIMFTGRGREEVAIQALNLGADQYLNKTGPPETVYGELANAIHAVIKTRRTEEALKKSEEQLRSIFDAAVDGIAYIDPSGKILAANKRLVEELLGYDLKDTIGQNFVELGRMEPKELPGVLDAMKEVLITGKSLKNFEVTLIRKDGGKVATEISTGALKRESEVIGITVIVRDISDRKKAEALYKNVVRLSPDSVLTVDSKGVITSCNDSAIKMMGFSKKEMIGKHFSRIGVIRVRDLPKFLKLFSSVLKGKVNDPIELPFCRKDGSLLIAEVRVGLLKENNKIIGIQAISRDITDRKKQEQEFRESKQKFENLFRDNPEAAVYVDQNYCIADINPRFTKLFGYRLNEIRGKTLLNIIVPEDKVEEAKTLDEKAKKGHVYFDTLRKRKDGAFIPVSISAAPIKVENTVIGYVGLYKDIAAIKKAEAEMRESRRHFQTLFDLMADPVAIVDKKGKILEITQSAEEVTGFTKKELVGKNFLRTKIATTKAKAILIKNLAKRMMGMHMSPYEVEMLTKDGRKLPYEVNATKIEYKGKAADLVVFRDISERKKMQEKLHVVGRLTRHDVRNKLSAITGNVYLAKKKVTNYKALEHLSDVDSACKQIESIFEFARTYERLGVEKLVSIDVGKTFEKAISLFSNLSDVRLVNECQGLRLLADTLLMQLFYNLVDNSLRHGKRVSQIRFYYEEVDDDHLKLVYEDDGIGISKAEKQKIFEEGYGKHTGYGLYLIRKICEVYGWTISETGEQGKGVEFTIIVPKK
jgi:PAS domain S-box-containing protein